MAALNWRTSSAEDAQVKMAADPGLYGRVQADFSDAYNGARIDGNPAYVQLDAERAAFQRRMGDAGTQGGKLLVLLEARDHFLGRKADWDAQREQERQLRFKMAHAARMVPVLERQRQDRAASLSAPLNTIVQDLSAGLAAAQGRFWGISAPGDLVPVANDLETLLSAALGAVQQERKALKAQNSKAAA